MPYIYEAEKHTETKAKGWTLEKVKSDLIIINPPPSLSLSARDMSFGTILKFISIDYVNFAPKWLAHTKSITLCSAIDSAKIN